MRGEWRLFNRAEVRGYADGINEGHGQSVCLVAHMETSDGDLLASSKAIAKQLIDTLEEIQRLQAALLSAHNMARLGHKDAIAALQLIEAMTHKTLTGE